MAQVTFKLPDGSRVRSSSQRAYVLISHYVNPQGQAEVRIAKRSDKRETLLKERARGHSTGISWYIGRHADRSLEVLV